MQNVSFGDVLFIILILGLIHGLMYLVGWLRKRAASTDESIMDK